MKKILYTEELKQKHKEKYNEQKILAEIRKEIDEKGFSIIEADEQIFFKGYYEKNFDGIKDFFMNYNNMRVDMNYIYYFIVYYFIVCIYLFACLFVIFKTLSFSYDIKEIYIAYSLIFCFTIGLILTPILFYINKYKKNDRYKLYHIKDFFYKYRNILVTEDKLFWGTEIIRIKDGNPFINDKIKDFLLNDKEKYFYEVKNEKERNDFFKKLEKIKKIIPIKIIRLKENFGILDKISEEIGKTKIEISKNLEILELKNFKDLLEFLSQKIEETKTTREKIKKELENSTYKNYFDMEKYENYLKTSLLEPLIGIKEILERQIKYSDYLYEKTKNIDSVAVELSHKRLEIQKNALQKQIILINEKIKKLEI